MNTTPPRFAPGPVDGAQLEKAFSVMYRGVLAPQDPRYPNNDFAAGLVATETGGVTLGVQAKPVGRSAGLPAIVGNISDAGRANNQKFLSPLMSGNRNSVQSASAILSSTSTATTGTINITAHSVKYDFGAVAYNSGSITGLNPNAPYLIYADDPDYEGGAVSYLASTDPNDVIAPGRYYVGGLMTGVAATIENISTANTANPLQITTATNHGWSSGDQVSFAGLPGGYGTALNGTTQTITVNGLNTFTVPVNGTSLTGSFPAGTATRVSVPQSGGGGAAAGGVTGRWSGFSFA